MRILFAIPLLMLLAVPGSAQPGLAGPGPAAASHDEARWAEWEAQARITDGDYDGAIQAEQQANAERHEADRQEMVARSSKK